MLSESQRALLIARLRQGRQATPTGIPRRPADAGTGTGGLPLSFGQEQLWFLDRFEARLSTYTILCTLRIRGPLDVPALAHAVEAVVGRHEALRTRFVSDAEGNPRQEIGEPAAVDLPLLDLTGVGDGADAGPEAVRARLHDAIRALWDRPFDLSQGPLIRFELTRTATDEHVLVVVVHHIVFDGWSAGVLLREVAALYEARVTGRAPELPELPVQVADVALWERERLSGPVLDGLHDHWRRILAGSPNLDLPTDWPRPALMAHEGGVERLDLGAGALAGVRALSSQEGTTPAVVLMAAFVLLLHRYSGQDDVVVGTLSANRGRAELAPLIGYLVNTLPIRADLSGDPTVSELIAQLRAATVEAYAHQELPFAKLVEALRVERDPSRGSVVQALVTYVEPGDGAIAVAGGVTFEEIGPLADPDTAKFELMLVTRVVDGGLQAELSFATALFDRSTVRRMLGNLGVLLEGMAEDVTRPVSQAPVLTGAELRRELAEWNDTRVELPTGCVHEHFERQAGRTPDGVAAELDAEVVTYAELDAQANRIARRLHASGVGPEVFVGVSMAPSTRRLAVLLGILKAGGAYVPLDPALPAERLAYMMADTAMPVLVADDAGVAALPDTAATVLPIDREWERIGELDGGNAGFAVEPANAAYAIYTSGSTGRPKGVVVEHRQVVNHALGMAEQWQVGPADRVLQFASLNFDVSVMDMFTALLSGARAVVASNEVRLSPPRLAALIREREVTFACLPPAVLNLLTGERFPRLRMLMVAGEEFPVELERAWLRPGLRLVNGYGPTEDTVIATFAELDGSVAPPPIGLPVANQQAYVLDARLHPVPVGVVGELYLGGAGVARGYLNAPELTEQRFIPDPFRDEPGARLYKTGDLVRRLPDGKILFLGRRDGQVKIRGLRVELGEIEAALMTHPEVAQVVVMTAEDAAGQRMLVGYVRPRSRGSAPAAGPAELRRHLAEALPAYMIPAHLVILDSFPLNASGKIDRAALPPVKPAEAATESGTEGVAPETPTERTLADIYAGLLGLPRVSVDQGFFELGGNSLQAMRLVTRIHRELGVDIAVTSVFLAPSVRRLAARIEQAGGAARAAGSGPLVELSEGTGSTPLFIAHAIGGTVHPYAPLAACLAGDFRVYGIEAAGLTEGAAAVASLDAMVASYLDAILAAQPEGPYRLAGWSMGGLVAYEIARRLEELGRDVAQVVLLDAPFALPERTEPESVLAARFAADAALALGWETEGPDAASAATDHLDWLARRVAGSEGDLDAVRGQIERRFEVFKANTALVAGFRPGAALRARTLLVSALRSPNAAVQPDWTRLLGENSTLLPVDADHYSFLRPPLVEKIADSIAQPPLGDTMQLEMEIAGTARENLARVLASDLAPADFDLDLDLSDGYGLTSLNKVLFLMAVCDETGVGLSAFTEADVAAMRTLGDVVAALAAHAGGEN